MRIALVMLMLIGTIARSQSIRGTVFDQQTKVPLPYANLGVKGKSIGGITDKEGNFSIDISRAAATDSLIVSYVGYRSLGFSVATLAAAQPMTIYLVPAPHILDEVVIGAKQEIVVLGNDKRSRLHSGWGDFSSSKGRAFGLLISAPLQPVKVNKIFFHLHENEFDSIRLRINLFNTDQKTILPLQGQSRNIFITVSQRKGWVQVPLSETLILHADVIVAIEWVDAWAKPRSLEEGGSYTFTLSLGRYQGFQYRRENPEEPLELSLSELCPSIYLECVPFKR